jgi:hypothetical protein
MGVKIYLKNDGVAVFCLETLHEVILVGCLSLGDVQKHVVDLHHFAKIFFTIDFSQTRVKTILDVLAE